MNFREIQLTALMVRAAAHLLPGRPQELDVGLGVVDAGQDVEQLGLVPGKVGEPVLDKGGAVRERSNLHFIQYLNIYISKKRLLNR